MSVSDFFALFDLLLIEKNADSIAKSIDATNVRKTFVLKEFCHSEGKLHKELFEFLCWLVADNEREMYISKQCTIKFIHSQAKDDLLKV